MPLKYLRSHALDIGIWLGQPSLAALCVLVVSREPNPINPAYYYGAIFTFLIISTILFVKIKSIALPICNYLMIFAVLAGRPLSMPLNLCLFIYPMIEGIIFRGKIQNIYVLLPASLITSLGLMSFDGFNGFILLFNSLLWVANIYRSEEDKMIINENKVYDSFDDLIRSQNVTRHTYEISRKFMEEWNLNHKDTQIEAVETYYRSDSNFFLINADKFSWNRRLHLSEKAIEKLCAGKVVTDDLKLYGRQSIHYLIPVIVDKGIYAVKYDVVYRRGVSWFEKRGIERTLTGVSAKLVNLLALVHRLRTFEASYLEENKTKKKYIDTAIGTMHFIRNRLTSIANLVEFLRLSPEEREVIPESVAKDLYKSASHDYWSIKKYADDLLNKEKYPFGEREVEEVPIQSLYVYLAETVENHLKVYVDTSEVRYEYNPHALVNFFELKTILTDWISNMERHGEGFSVEWSQDGSGLTITFRNVANYEDCDKVVNALTNDNVEIRHTRKQSFGINIIRELAWKNNIMISPLVDRTEDADKAILAVSFKIPVKNEE